MQKKYHNSLFSIKYKHPLVSPSSRRLVDEWLMSHVSTSQWVLLTMICPSGNHLLSPSDIAWVCADMDQYARRMVSSGGVYSNEEYYMALKYKILNYKLYMLN
jgi:hypothetical protein